MSGTKKDRQSLKNRFKKGMYPTEDDFADVFESYVHKDDTIEMSKVVLKEGGETVSEVIDKKADKKTLDAFIEEVDTVLETVRDAETGEITKTVIQDLSKRIKDAEDDIAETSNTAEKNENAIAKILSILGKQDGETVSELAARFTALSGDYATVYAFVSKVKAFLESADVADTTINRWQEIENFLQGITDTETLTGLLKNLKTEIKNEIPKGNFLEQVADLDGYTDAEDGKIVQYIGQTNDKYTRGHFYERIAGESTENSEPITMSIGDINLKASDIEDAAYNGTDDISGLYHYRADLSGEVGIMGNMGNMVVFKNPIAVGDPCLFKGKPDVLLDEDVKTGVADWQRLVFFERESDSLLVAFNTSEWYYPRNWYVMQSKDVAVAQYLVKGRVEQINPETVTISEPTSEASWQHIPVSPVIS